MRTVIQPPAEEAVSLAMAKTHLRIEAGELDSDGEALLLASIEAVRQMAEDELIRPLLPQTCMVRFDSLRAQMRLWNDVTSVTKVEYRDADGAEREFPLERCNVQERGILALRGDLPKDASAVRVTFACGAWATPAAVPRSVVQWMLLQLGTLSQVRQSVTYGQTFAVPGPFVGRLLDPFRLVEI
ncbi:head-tail connector protein [Ralstonia nicotianae]